MGLALAIEQELAEEIPNAVQRIEGSAKVIAFKLGKTSRCIEGIRQGLHLPSLPVALALAQVDEEFRALLHKFTYAHNNPGGSGDDPIQLANELVRALQARQR